MYGHCMAKQGDRERAFAQGLPPTFSLPVRDSLGPAMGCWAMSGFWGLCLFPWQARTKIDRSGTKAEVEVLCYARKPLAACRELTK